MNLSRPAKVILSLGVLLGLLVFAGIVEVGHSAGVVHPGVSVGGVDVGGMTLSEAADRLEERGEELKYTPIRFVREDLVLTVVPAEIGWGPHPYYSAAAAMAVGRERAPFGALVDRIKAWIEGVDLSWAGSTSAPAVGRLLNQWEEKGAEAGLTLDRAKMRFKIRRAIITFPRRSFRIPILDS